MMAYPAMGVVIFLLAVLVMNPASKAPTEITSSAAHEGDIGFSAGGVDEKARIMAMEKNYYSLEETLKELQKQIKYMDGVAKEMKMSQKEMNKSVSKLDDNFSAKIDARLEDLRQEMSPNHSSSVVDERNMELAVANIQEIKRNDDGDSVYLPLGSFCKGTLLTGVYAAADQNNPLPVLIALDEAFYGPNQSRIPLKGAFVLGKAYGDLVSERALIQIIAISSVLPDGVTFENEQNLGYVTDGNGELGIHGVVIRNTGRQLATSFLGGFLAGGAQGLSDQEVTTRETDSGRAVKSVTGNGTKNAMFQGLAKSAGQFSDYYAKQAENLVPAIHIQNGQEVYFIVQKGVTINGLSRLNLASTHRISD